METNSFLPDQGRVGTPAVCATMLEAILSPSSHIACSEGPINMIPFLAKSSGSFGFSEAWPQPAQTAVKFVKNLFVVEQKVPLKPITRKSAYLTLKYLVLIGFQKWIFNWEVYNPFTKYLNNGLMARPLLTKILGSPMNNNTILIFQ